MAFKNAYLTEEEKKMMEEAKIHDPRYSMAANKFLTPRNWTIDRERNIALIYCGELDREEYYKDVFVVFYKKFDNEHMWSFTLIRKRFDKEKASELKNKYGADGVQKWLLIDKKIPKLLSEEIKDAEVYEVLTEALSEYGVNGQSDQDYVIKAFLEIGGEIIL